jgi:hypothetical protein
MAANGIEPFRDMAVQLRGLLRQEFDERILHDITGAVGITV